MDNSPIGIEALVCKDIASRQAVGIKKYGVTLDKAPMTRREIMVHQYQEVLDLAIYLKTQIERDSHSELNMLPYEGHTVRPANKLDLQWVRAHGEPYYTSKASSRVFYVIRDSDLGTMSLFRVVDARETRIARHMVGEYQVLQREAQADWNSLDELSLPELPDCGFIRKPPLQWEQEDMVTYSAKAGNSSRYRICLTSRSSDENELFVVRNGKTSLLTAGTQKWLQDFAQTDWNAQP